MSFPTVSYRKTANLRIRSVEEWQRCVVYTPDQPRLRMLNATAWLILELCDGRDMESIVGEYAETVADRTAADEARREVIETLARLEESGIIQRVE